jgi:hypothetical protein
MAGVSAVAELEIRQEYEPPPRPRPTPAAAASRPGLRPGTDFSSERSFGRDAQRAGRGGNGRAREGGEEVDNESPDPQREEADRKHKGDIDGALGLCTRHLKKLGKPELAREAIRRPRDDYLEHGIEAAAGGLKFG